MRNNHNTSSHLSAAQQTRMSWTKFIEDYDQIPLVYQDVFNNHFLPGSKFPYTILVPAFADFLRPDPEKLVCCSEQVITIFEKRSDKIRATSLNYTSIHYVEVGTVLLHSWLTIFGMDQQGNPAAPSIQFNTVGEELFLPILSRLRTSSGNLAVNQLEVEKARFDYLSNINFKFMNYGRRSIRKGDRVVKIIVQPEIRKEILKVFGKSFSQQISPAHILILTNQEIISIRDGAMKTSTYGGIWNYISRDMLQFTSLREDENGRLILGLEMRSDHKINMVFDASQKPVIENFREEIQSN